MWSSVYLPAGPLADQSFRLFAVPLGLPGGNGRVFDCTDTNLREGSRTLNGVTYRCDRARWIVCPVEAISDLEKLAQAYSTPMCDLIYEHGTLAWDFLQTRLPLGPLRLNDVALQTELPSNSSWNVVLSFGAGAPVLNMEHVVRVVLEGAFSTISIG